MGEHAFWLVAIRRLDVQYGIEIQHVGIPFEHGPSGYAVQRRESHRPLVVAGQDEPNAPGAEAAGPVVQKDWWRYGRTPAHTVFAAPIPNAEARR